VILLAGASADSGRQVADRILAAVESPDQARSIRVSLGIASGGTGTPFEVVVDRADGAMYTAKRARRDALVRVVGLRAVRTAPTGSGLALLTYRGSGSPLLPITT